jgi:hypothetical protein
MANVINKIKRLKISKYQKTIIRSNEDQKIKRRCTQAQQNAMCTHPMLESPKDQLIIQFVSNPNS